MSLKYALYQNPLNPKGAGKEDYTARPVDVRSYNLEEIIELMLQQGSTITRADTLAVLTNFFEAIVHITENGGIINTELFKTLLSVSGVVLSATDHLNKETNHVNVNVHAGNTLKDAGKKIKLEKVDVAPPLPHILEVKDSVSGSVNDRITSQGVAEISGARLKVEGTDASNGVFFVAADGTRNKVVTMVENMPSKLIVVVPTLTAGSYRLEIATQFSSGKTVLKHPRTGVFDKVLTVT